MIGKKGGAVTTWAFVMFGVFLVGILFVVMSEPYNIIYNITSSANLTANQQATADRIYALWDHWPILTVLVLVIGGIVAVMRGNPETRSF